MEEALLYTEEHAAVYLSVDWALEFNDHFHTSKAEKRDYLPILIAHPMTLGPKIVK